MELTRERALELHRQMWSDMQKDLGDDPTREQRFEYKRNWLEKNFPDSRIRHNCFLCEYANVDYSYCEEFCPVEWPAGRCEDGREIYDTDLDEYHYPDDWTDMPISRLLSLPEREIEE